MATAPTCNWDLVFSATTDFLQQVCNKNFATNTQLRAALSEAPTISLTSANQIAFTCLPKNHPGTYVVNLNLASVSVTPVTGDDDATFTHYQMCFAEAGGEAPFSVSPGSGGDQASAMAIQDNLNDSVSGQCFTFETNVRRNQDGIEISPTVEALLQALSPQYMSFASLLDSSGAAAGQLLAPIMSASATPPSESPFTAFSGSSALNIAGNSPTSNSLYALWDYFLLDSIVKPKLANSFGISESAITVSTGEPAVLTVTTPIEMDSDKGKEISLENFTMQVTSSGIALSMTCVVEKDVVIAGNSLSATVHGNLSFTLAQTVDNTTDPATVGFEIVDLDASFDQEEVAKYVSLGVMNTVYHAFDAINPGPPLSYIYLLIAIIVFAIVDVVLLAILAMAGENMDEVTQKIEDDLNAKFDDNRRDVKSAVTINEIVYDCGTISFLTIDVASYEPSSGT